MVYQLQPKSSLKAKINILKKFNYHCRIYSLKKCSYFIPPFLQHHPIREDAELCPKWGWEVEIFFAKDIEDSIFLFGCRKKIRG